MLHYGRADMTVAFYGCKIAPPDVQEALMSTPTLASRVQSFTMFTAENERVDKSLQICLELEAGQFLADSEAARASQDFFTELQRINQDFRESWRMLPEVQRPHLAFYPAQTGPFAAQDMRIKHRYIQAAPNPAPAAKPPVGRRPATRLEARPSTKRFNLFDF
ncbi:hypothetical protein [Hymenobacter cellulosilyticus]|uniref:Uncharacterized protein n=1 Tax=Hymenobacter cellulosilyticus TaxID=2932248 RepID=A0A8T9QC22_9BACT|nr:hypothetical protein [Hymenobacter cellulosilyticus]UOQ74745.1 hypothetical protein MUN79_13220 [Hymenobacter cellulosilyticus]